ncbi:DUF2062 domain-containing protein [Saccharobesus litoralis]|uniref:DUF2062 domain-containing protein n=1 Tax=Saccharobesus litoralis TaxID=2172099 RepID=A0A2S0VTA7_9ALTE|nr:DUF2062 domain-containing protein [Saccharobesus litoralis]AWB67448.1 DUF2062 domain-containing protein [Saccharobesus litoralis]
MPKKTIKKFMPDHDTIRNNKSLKIFGPLLNSPNLWCLNRRSIAGAFALGLFNAFIPVPFQMWLSALGAIIFRVNLPLSVALVWITNPFTMPPIFYFCYLVGEWVMGPSGHKFAFEMSWDWLAQSVSTIGPTFLVGCLVCSVVASCVGYITINVLWRHSVRKHWQTRHQKPKAA